MAESEPDGDRRRPDYRLARIAIAGAFTGLLCFLAIFDALSHEYELQPTTLVVLVTVILALLGLELRDIVTRIKEG